MEPLSLCSVLDALDGALAPSFLTLRDAAALRAACPRMAALVRRVPWERWPTNDRGLVRFLSAVKAYHILGMFPKLRAVTIVGAGYDVTTTALYRGAELRRLRLHTNDGEATVAALADAIASDTPAPWTETLQSLRLSAHDRIHGVLAALPRLTRLTCLELAMPRIDDQIELSCLHNALCALPQLQALTLAAKAFSDSPLAAVVAAVVAATPRWRHGLKELSLSFTTEADLDVALRALPALTCLELAFATTSPATYAAIAAAIAELRLLTTLNLRTRGYANREPPLVWSAAVPPLTTFKFIHSESRWEGPMQLRTLLPTLMPVAATLRTLELRRVQDWSLAALPAAPALQVLRLYHCLICDGAALAAAVLQLRELRTLELQSSAAGTWTPLLDVLPQLPLRCLGMPLANGDGTDWLQQLPRTLEVLYWFWNERLPMLPPLPPWCKAQTVPYNYWDSDEERDWP